MRFETLPTVFRFGNSLADFELLPKQKKAVGKVHK
jgi:hypothetical protein